jgi:hypothetical protein
LINNSKNGESHSQSPFEIIEEQFKDFGGILVKQRDIDTYGIYGEDIYAYLYRHNDDEKWLLEIAELTTDSPTKLKSISSAFANALKNLNK